MAPDDLNAPDTSIPGDRPRRWRGTGTKVALVAAGVAAGGVLAATLTAGAATTPSTGPSTGSSAPAAPAPGWEHGPGDRGGFHGLNLTGTVVSVSSNTVTIKTSSGTTTYLTDARSDIDKNGEATLSSLVAGDAVRFNTNADGKTIDKLHAGDEAKDMPAGPPPGGPAAPGTGTASGTGYAGA